MSATAPTQTTPMTDEQLEALEAWGNVPVSTHRTVTRTDYIDVCNEADGLIREAVAEIKRLRGVNATLAAAGARALEVLDGICDPSITHLVSDEEARDELRAALACVTCVSRPAGEVVTREPGRGQPQDFDARDLLCPPDCRNAAAD